tara:strand:- start:2481 stop:2843 length:363 start_codon:yes stop_codon:yes gene_type:complete
VKKRTIITVTILLCLIIQYGTLTVLSLNASDKNEASPLVLALNNFRDDGFTILGPVQYLGKTPSAVRLYRHPNVTYKRLQVINHEGYPRTIKKNDFVYVLKKDSKVVLMQIERKEGKNEI